jgi:hypothetical protein
MDSWPNSTRPLKNQTQILIDLFNKSKGKEAYQTHSMKLVLSSNQNLIKTQQKKRKRKIIGMEEWLKQ